MNKERNICIVGLGLLGGSYAMGLTDAGYTVTAVDVRPEAIRYALEKGIIAAGAVEHADCAIFKPANFIIVPTEKNTPRGLAFARGLAETLGFAHITQLTCAEHDKMIGYVSQLTHAIAVSLMNANDNTHLAEYTGDSFRDLTRIAKINENLWSELFFLNKENLIAEIDQFSASLEGLKRALVENDETELKRLFVQSTARRRLFDKKREAR